MSRPKLTRRINKFFKRLLEPRNRVRGAAILLVLSLVCWPLAHFWWAKDEPPFVLALSFLAITLTCADVLATADVRKEQDDANGDGDTT